MTSQKGFNYEPRITNQKSNVLQKKKKKSQFFISMKQWQIFSKESFANSLSLVLRFNFSSQIFHSLDRTMMMMMQEWLVGARKKMIDDLGNARKFQHSTIWSQPL